MVNIVDLFVRNGLSCKHPRLQEQIELGWEIPAIWRHTGWGSADLRVLLPFPSEVSMVCPTEISRVLILCDLGIWRHFLSFFFSFFSICILLAWSALVAFRDAIWNIFCHTFSFILRTRFSLSLKKLQLFYQEGKTAGFCLPLWFFPTLAVLAEGNICSSVALMTIMVMVMMMTIMITLRPVSSILLSPLYGLSHLFFVTLRGSYYNVHHTWSNGSQKSFLKHRIEKQNNSNWWRMLKEFFHKYLIDTWVFK